MRRGDLIADDQLEAVMERGRTIQRAPDLVRARLLARARATASAANLASAPMLTPATPSRWRGLRVALAASVVLSLAAAGATAALRARAAHAPEIVPTSVPHLTASSVRRSAPEPSAMAPIPAPTGVHQEPAYQPVGFRPRVLFGRARAASARSVPVRQPQLFGCARVDRRACPPLPERTSGRGA